MRRWVHFSSVAGLLWLPVAGLCQAPLEREAGGWARVYTAALAAAPKLRVLGHGPVTVDADASRKLEYTVRVSVAARSEAEARRILDAAPLRVATQGDWVVLAAPGGPVMAQVRIKAPRLAALDIATTDGAVAVTGVDGATVVDTRAGAITADRMRGSCKLASGGGEIRVGTVDGSLECTTAAGRIQVKLVRLDAVLNTYGGDIEVDQVEGALRADTAGGGIHVRKAGGSVAATSGGGQIVVDQAKGTVTARNLAGPVAVGGAAGVHCESGAGGIRLARITGPMRVSTSMGSILADLAGARLADSFLATASGDITVVIPSNLGVNIRAVNAMADTLRRIVSDYATLPPRRTGNRIVAEGALNGGGPLIEISDTGGTIFIKRP
ncbi:MAG: hypothetical protein ACLQVN_24090 [Bryobacteraceae bacterium]